MHMHCVVLACAGLHAEKYCDLRANIQQDMSFHTENKVLIYAQLAVQGLVTVSLASQSFNTTLGDQITLSAAPLTYRKQTACIPVVTTASEYT